MVWVIVAMALLWAWGVSREDATYAPPPPQAALPVSSVDLLFIDGPQGRIDVADARTQSTSRYLPPVRVVFCAVF